MLDPRDRRWLAEVRRGHHHGPFGHREHLRVAWLLLEDTESTSRAEEEVSRIVRSLAVRHGKPQRYNRTLTDTWVRIVAHCRAASGSDSFDDLLARHPWLLDKRVIRRHYTSRLLASPQARRTRVEPDVLALPTA
ncbi:MAG TPA: hypothetical protein VGK78_12410 [Nocardioides sp.]|uniref:hypothetical protein n=1 Tax=Nocardioides sp. TaxID=35761 RepID=UPI002F3EE9C5